MVTRIFCTIALLMVVGCSSLRDGYTTRFGLANPDISPVQSNPVDEAYSGGTIGQPKTGGVAVPERGATHNHQ